MWRAFASALPRVALHPLVPPLVSIPLIFGFWAAEAYLHTEVFNGGTLLRELTSPGGHEIWMRSLEAGTMLGLALVWSWALDQQREHAQRMTRYRERLRLLSAHMAYGEAEERRTLSHQLHEDLGQLLVAARMRLAALDLADAPAEDREALSVVREILEGAVVECREIAQELSPPALETYGLEGALEVIGPRLERRTGVRVETDCEDRCTPLDRETLQRSFLAIVELLQAVAVDPKTSRVRVTTRADDRTLAIAIEWDSADDVDLFGPAELLTKAGGRMTRSRLDGVPRVLVTVPVTSG